ncbi:Hypothetical protein IALB_0126 [Ignavibacterium album JCM 16511]|uniref:Uncharacterized protein n=1 Tax=Ignavibacterium album (strain DSM 19864 / JCM 16511 / NBRC 101810 / Mat9-16) TaxID=945713 RepID=I0AFT1_IGNAJ|nr:DUF6544 family protein [Ignavibacterium album]AFH47838.1 Hypothetical protein IALB_0126 [Ignavibacterium album JCM 16511]
MKWIFFFIVLVHALIHILGFLKAFQLAEINQLTQNISKPMGIFWLIALILFLAAAIQFISNYDLWWLTGLAAVILSQVLIILFWQDAKFGTIPNIIILFVAIITFAGWSFNLDVKNEVTELLSKSSVDKKEILNEDKISHLPPVIQKWLKNSGVVGREMINTVYLKQRGQIRMKPEQESWYNSQAEQWFTVDNPAFIWKVKVDMMPLVFFIGRDKFSDGKGSMLIKILSLINIVNSSDNEKINQGTLQRFLGEIVWFPTAAVSPYIKWEQVDSVTARATMTYKGTTGSALFYFNDNGDFVKFSAMRFMGTENDSQLKEWTITLNEYKIYDGIKIPVKGEATWKLDDGDFTWYKLEIYDVKYNHRVMKE